jgi:hypothetical protein
VREAIDPGAGWQEVPWAHQGARSRFRTGLLSIAVEARRSSFAFEPLHPAKRHSRFEYRYDHARHGEDARDRMEAAFGNVWKQGLAKAGRMLRLESVRLRSLYA